MKLKIYAGQEIDLPDNDTYFVSFDATRYEEPYDSEYGYTEKGTEITTVYRIVDTAPEDELERLKVLLEAAKKSGFFTKESADHVYKIAKLVGEDRAEIVQLYSY